MSGLPNRSVCEIWKVIIMSSSTLPSYSSSSFRLWYSTYTTKSHFTLAEVKNNREKRFLDALSYWIGISQIPEGSFFAHQFPVDHHGEVDIQNTVVINGQTQNDADQCVLALVFKGRGIEPKQFGSFIIREHA